MQVVCLFESEIADNLLAEKGKIKTKGQVEIGQCVKERFY
jgi:hypothetical protein